MYMYMNIFVRIDDLTEFPSTTLDYLHIWQGIFKSNGDLVVTHCPANKIAINQLHCS